MSAEPDHVPPDPDEPAGEAAAAAAPADAPTPEEVVALKARAAAADDLEDRLKRAQAEFVNELRRIQRQAEQDRRFAIEGLVGQLMEVVSSLDQALAAAGAQTTVDSLRTGVSLLRQQIEDLLKRHGAEVLRPTGQPFDPAAHEAVATVEHAELPPGTVAQVLAPGLRLHGRVSKPAQVLVTRTPTSDGAAPPAQGA